MHRRNINLTATNKSYTDQGLKFSEPDSGVLSTSIDGLMNHPYKSRAFLNSDFFQNFQKFRNSRIQEILEVWRNFEKNLNFPWKNSPLRNSCDIPRCWEPVDSHIMWVNLAIYFLGKIFHIRLFPLMRWQDTNHDMTIWWSNKYPKRPVVMD